MKWPRLVCALLVFSACSSPKPPPEQVRFAAPPGFVALDTISRGAKSYVDFRTHEKLAIGYSRHAPPRSIPPGQKISTFYMCKNVPATVWEFERGHEIWVRFFVPVGGGRYFEALYTRPKQARRSRNVMYALTTACPQ